MSKIIRLTLFKLDPAHIEETIAKYSTLTHDAVKDSKPYILAGGASPTLEDPRSQGYTLLARTVFRSKEDMDYYDNECKAHGEIKALLKEKLTSPPLVVYMSLPEGMGE